VEKIPASTARLINTVKTIRTAGLDMSHLLVVPGSVCNEEHPAQGAMQPIIDISNTPPEDAQIIPKYVQFGLTQICH
jgi:hypothetical protein